MLWSISKQVRAAEACVEIINSIQKVSSKVELDKICTEVEGASAAIDQLITSLQSSTRSAKRVVARRKTDKQKQVEDEKMKDTEAKRKELEQQAKKVKAMAQFKTSTAIFFVDWAKIGFKGVPFYETKAAVSGDFKDGLLSLPFRLAAGYEGLQALATDPNGRGEDKLMPPWHVAIQAPLVEKMAADAVSHRLTENDNVTQIVGSMAGIVEDSPSPWIGQSEVVAYLQQSMEPVLFGYGPTYVRFDFNENYLGAIKVVSKGTLKFMFMHPAAVAQWIEENPQPWNSLAASERSR